MSYYYGFEGAKDSNNGLYGFGRIGMSLNLFSLQYQLTPNWTLMAMGQFVDLQVQTHIAGMDGQFSDRTAGFGDTLLLAVRPLYMGRKYFLISDFGVGVPTGGINYKNKSFPASGLNYPYNMQMGSGTYDAIAELTQLTFQGPVQLGSKVSATVRTGTNQNGYRLGNLYRMDAWADYPLKSGFTPRLVGYYRYKEGVNGQDSGLGAAARAQILEYYYNAQIDWNMAAAMKYQYNFNSAVSVGGEVGVPFIQGNINSDQVQVYTRYYASLFMNGAF